MAGLRLIATRRFAVYGNTGENVLGDRQVLEKSNSSTRSAGCWYGAAGGMTFEKDGAEIEVPTMRLRELNKSNASRCVHVDCCYSNFTVHPCTSLCIRSPASCDGLPLDRRNGQHRQLPTESAVSLISHSLNAAPGLVVASICHALYQVPGPWLHTYLGCIPVMYGCCSL